jgi:PAS domain S-box-containing protein
MPDVAREEGPVAEPRSEAEWRAQFQARIDAEERFRLAMEATSDGIWDWNIATGEVYFSPAYTRMLGFEPEAFAARVEAWTELIVPEDRERVLEANEACIRGEYPAFEVEYRMRARDGSLKWILGRGRVVLRDGQGRAMRMVGTHLDVTERKRVEAALLASEERYRSLFESSQAVMVVLDPENETILDANPAAVAFYGWTREELLRKRLYDINTVSRAQMRSVLGEVEAGSRRQFEFQHRLADGSVRDVEVFACALSGLPLRMFSLIHDITDRRKAEEQVRQSQKLDSLGSLAGGVAHDMNNVLGAILGLASANLEFQPAGSPAARAFETIAKAATRGGEMVRSLLAFARRSQAEERELDVNGILLEEARLLERTTLSRVSLVQDLEPRLQAVRGDGGALAHAIMNLCVNAVEAMPGGGTLTLRTRNADPGWIEITVEDTGTGMSGAVVAKAMDPFFTTKEVGKGTGLGLSLVYSTVKAHEGTIGIESRPGEGTRVRIRLPACHERGGPAAHTGVSSRRDEEGQAPPPPGLRVLLVDDDELVQHATTTLLQALGHSVRTCSRGEEALEAIKDGYEPEAVLLDINMPGLGGGGTLPLLRALLPAVPILLSSGRTDQAALELARAHPRVKLLPKPFTIQELRRCLES